MYPSSEQILPQPSSALSDPSKAAGKKKKPKALKDPSAPKRPLSAFFQFSQEQRPVVMAELGNISVTEVGKELGKRWAALDKETKSKYENLVTEAKAKYEEQMKTYQPSQEYLEKRAELDKKKDQKVMKHISEYFTFVEQNWRKVAVEYKLMEEGRLQERLWKTWNEEKENIVKKKDINKTNNNHVKKISETAFSIFQKEMKEKLEKVAGRPISDMEMSGLVVEKWKTLDNEMKIDYEKQAEAGTTGNK